MSSCVCVYSNARVPSSTAKTAKMYNLLCVPLVHHTMYVSCVTQISSVRLNEFVCVCVCECAC